MNVAFLCNKMNKDEFVNSLSQLIKSNPIITILDQKIFHIIAPEM